MRVSPKKLAAEAQKTGFRPDLLEKVAQLLGLLEAIQSHPCLRGKLALKGGTALNLFIFDVSRLSIDIDLNYIGSPDRDVMLAERPKIEQALHAVFAREGFKVRRMPKEHAGGKWSLRYASAPGQSRNLEVDINFMHRLPLWPISVCDSHAVASWRARRDVSAADVDCDPAELERRLIPTLRLRSGGRSPYPKTTERALWNHAARDSTPCSPCGLPSGISWINSWTRTSSIQHS
jgi:Nucleotidyl transferase AbiEii toxin, Type IV TA system